MTESLTYTAFANNRRIVSGDVATMLRETKAYLDTGTADTILIFEDLTGKQLDFDFRGTVEEVLARVASHAHFATAEPTPPAKKGPGRPHLGVVGGEVSLLPRHWDWLGEQPGGISATVRRLVDEERKRTVERDRARVAWDAAGKFMWTMGGNLAGFEEASRALYAHDTPRLDSLIQPWPTDVRDHVRQLVAVATRREQEAAAKRNDIASCSPADRH